MHWRGVHFLSFLELRDLVLVSLSASNVHGWYAVVILDPTNDDDKTKFVRHCQAQESQSTYLMVPVGAKAPLQKHLQVGVQLCGRPMLVAGLAFAIASGFLGNDYSNNQAEDFALLQCLFRALRLQDTHVIFEVDSLILAKQLARHLPWLVVLKISYMFVIPFQLFTSRGTFVIFTVSSTRPQIHCLIKRSTSVIRMVFQHFGSGQSAHHVYLSFPSVVFILSDFRTTLECQMLCTCLLCTFHSACQKKGLRTVCHISHVMSVNKSSRSLTCLFNIEIFSVFR